GRIPDLSDGGCQAGWNLQRGVRQARCKERIRLRDCFSSSGVAGSAMRLRRFSSSSQTTTDSGQIRTSKFPLKSPSPQCGNSRPETICPSVTSCSPDDGEAITTESVHTQSEAKIQKRRNFGFISEQRKKR